MNLTPVLRQAQDVIRDGGRLHPVLDLIQPFDRQEHCTLTQFVMSCPFVQNLQAASRVASTNEPTSKQYSGVLGELWILFQALNVSGNLRPFPSP